MKISYKAALSATLALGCLTTSHALLIFELTNATLVTAPNSDALIEAKLTNTGSNSIFLNSSSLETDLFDASDWVDIQAEDLFADTPESLAAGQTWTGNLIRVTVGANAVKGNVQTGEYRLFGGDDALAQVELGSQNFAVQVVPEPATIGILAVGLALVRRRQPRVGLHS